MDLEAQKECFYEQVLPSRPNEWQVDEVFERLAGLDATRRQALLSHVSAIWPVSHSLCFTYLEEGTQALALFPAELLGEWVRKILALYERKGLVGAREFMAGVDKYFLGPRRGEAGVQLAEISSRMLLYICGVSGVSLQIAAAPLPSTDTRTIYLPDYLDVFSEKQKNILLYKMLVTLQWGQLASRIFTDVYDRGSADGPFAGYPDRLLAEDLFSVLQFIKVYRFLAKELPGMVRHGGQLCHRLIMEIQPEGDKKERSTALRNFLLHSTGFLQQREEIISVGAPIIYSLADTPWTTCCLHVLPRFYAYFENLAGGYRLGQAALLLGAFDFLRSGETVRLRREEEKKKFITMLVAFLQKKNSGVKSDNDGQAAVNDRTSDTLLLLKILTEEGLPKSGLPPMRLADGNPELPEELVGLASDIINDLGSLPEAYVQTAAGLAGGGIHRQEGVVAESANAPVAGAAYSYNEWDYRRGGYRDAWCSLYEKTLQPVVSSFVATTLEKYRSQHKRLLRQFAMLRPSRRVVRRRRHGDDIDLDALIEALCDTQAGIPPSDRLFTRSLRIERDITALFLVDMSNSTEGWISVALKEALVLLAEALETVGDRYGIYGFSGMRRSRSDLYHIKHPEEAYGIVVQQRIAAITPREYTRMGPPIRHLTKKLLGSPSRIRLLVVISDGKPEDYDNYKGQYAIEDTRKALLEARGGGVHPFCITIDKAAHEYLAHMFGRGNYIFVNDVSMLPAKMTEIYRRLTG